MTKLRKRRLFEFVTAILCRNEDCSPPLPWDCRELWQAVIPFADQNKVSAALPGALRAMKLWNELPADAAQLLVAINELNAERNEELLAQGLEVLAILQNASIRALPLKGLAYQLIGLHADDPGRRMMADLDILVAKDEADRAQNILIDAGYSPDPDPVIEEDSHHHLLPLVPDPQIHGPGAVEVHIGLGQARHDHLVPAAAFLNACVDIDVAGRSVAVPNITDLIDHAVTHSGLQMYQSVRRTIRLGDAFDIARLWKRVKSEGYGFSDLRIMQHPAAAAHLGACLLLTDTPPHELGPLATSARRYLKQVLLRQSLPNWASLEAAIIYNAILIRQDPRRLAAKIFDAKRYGNLIRLLIGNRK